MKDSLFKLNKFHKILKEAERNDVNLHFVLANTVSAVEEIIINGDEVLARNFYDTVQSQLNSLLRQMPNNEETLSLAKETSKKTLEVFKDVFELKIDERLMN